VLTSNNQFSIQLLQGPMFGLTQRAQQARPEITSVAQSNKTNEKRWTDHHWAQTQQKALNSPPLGTVYFINKWMFFSLLQNLVFSLD